MHSSPRYVIYKQSFYFSETAFLICKMERVMRMKQSNGSKGRGWVLNFACYTVQLLLFLSFCFTLGLLTLLSVKMPNKYSYVLNAPHTEKAFRPTRSNSGDCGINSRIYIRPDLMSTSCAMLDQSPYFSDSLCLLQELFHF